MSKFQVGHLVTVRGTAQDGSEARPYLAVVLAVKNDAVLVCAVPEDWPGEVHEDWQPLAVVEEPDCEDGRTSILDVTGPRFAWQSSPAVEYVCSTRSDFVTDTARVSGVSYEDAAERYAAGFQSDIGELRVYVCPADIFDSLDGEVYSSEDVWSVFEFKGRVVWSLV